MKNNDTGRTKTEEIRLRAEKTISLPREEFQQLQPANVLKLLKDLTDNTVDLEAMIEQLRQAEIDLAESRKQTDELFNFAPVGYFILDSQGVISNANFTASHIMGIPREKMINAPFVSLVDMRHYTAFRSYLDDMAQTGQISSTEIQMRKGDGVTFYAQLQSVVLYQKAVRIFRISVADITDRKRAEQALAESEKRFHTALDNMLEACVILDFNYRYIYANDSAVKMGRRTREERIGHTLMEVYPTMGKQEAFVRIKKCMEERLPDSYETEFTFPEGIKVWLDMRLTPVPEGILIVYYDITERKHAEQSMQRGIVRLERIYGVGATVGMQPIGLLMLEHRLIERVLPFLAREKARMEQTSGLSRDIIDYMVDFFRHYTDKTHHGKEEAVLFKALTSKGLSPEHKRIMDELVKEHELGRKLVSDLVSAKKRWESGDTGSLKKIIASMDELLILYPKHIETEDKHFFIPCMSYFTAEEQDDMLLESWEFDRQLVHQRYVEEVETLKAQISQQP